MNVLGWTADQGGCAWYRIKEPLRVVRQLGHQVRLTDRMTLMEGLSADVVVAQYIADDRAAAGWRQLCTYPRGPRCVYDLDDDLWSSPTYPRDALAVVEGSIAAAHLVTVSTLPLADIVRKFNPNVVVVPNGVPSWLFELETADELVPRVDDRFTLGWPTSVSHTEDLRFHLAQLDRVLRRNPGMCLHLIGPSGIDVLPPDQLVVTSWLPLPKYYRALLFDVLIAPLRPSAFNRSKSGIKAMEAAALGIPAVVSNEEPYRQVVDHGVTGFLVTRDHEWAQYLRVLHHDPELRVRMGQAARARAAAEWVNDANAERWLSAWGLARP